VQPPGQGEQPGVEKTHKEAGGRAAVEQEAQRGAERHAAQGAAGGDVDAPPQRGTGGGVEAARHQADRENEQRQSTQKLKKKQAYIAPIHFCFIGSTSTS
jgi:hypothetical protein